MCMAELCNGVPHWVLVRARELGDGTDLRIGIDSSERIVSLGQAAVLQWLLEGLPSSRTLNLFEAFCGAGGVSEAVAALGGTARGFDRTKGQLENGQGLTTVNTLHRHVASARCIGTLHRHSR